MMQHVVYFPVYIIRSCCYGEHFDSWQSRIFFV